MDKILRIILCICVFGCSAPRVANYQYIDAYTKEEKKVQEGFVKKKVVLIKDFRGNEMYEEDATALKEEIEEYISRHPTLDDSIKNNLRQLKLVAGMTRDETKLLLAEPEKVEKLGSRAKYDASELWIYRTNKLRAFTVFIFPVFVAHEGYYLYFKDGVLAEIEKHFLEQMVKQSDATGVGKEKLTK
jgi:hypothetical protein